MRIKILIQVFCLCYLLSFGQERADTSSLTILFAGDVMGHDSQINSAFDDSLNTYNYNPCFKYVTPYIRQADVAIANLEVTLAGKPFKGYPQFSSPDELAMALKNAGFDILITANNHSLDRGKNGLERTIDVLDSLEMIHTGVFKDSLERAVKYPLVFEKNNIKVALLNYTYGTNGLKTVPPNIVNYIDTAQVHRDIEKAKLVEPDYIIATVHWGLEYQREENMKQRALAKFIIENGADAIIGSHPHVVQPIKFENFKDSINKNIVVYSLGNYISNQRQRHTDGGIMFKMRLVKDRDDTIIDTYEYLPTWVYKPKIKDRSIFHIVPANSFRIDSLLVDTLSTSAMKVFYDDTRTLLKEIPESNYFYEINDNEN